MKVYFRRKGALMNASVDGQQLGAARRTAGARKRRLTALFVAGAAAVAMPVAAVSAHDSNCGVLPLLNCQIEDSDSSGGGGGGEGQQQQQQG